MKKKEIGKYLVFISTKHGLYDKTWLGEMRNGLSRRPISFCIFWKKFSLILCMNEFGLLANFKSDGRLHSRNKSIRTAETKWRRI